MVAESNVILVVLVDGVHGLQCSGISQAYPMNGSREGLQTARQNRDTKGCARSDFDVVAE
jgi:hypothetical protein